MGPPVCATDGKIDWTLNECSFEVSKCRAKLHDVTLTVKNKGPCEATEVPINIDGDEGDKEDEEEEDEEEDEDEKDEKEEEDDKEEDEEAGEEEAKTNGKPTRKASSPPTT